MSDEEKISQCAMQVASFLEKANAPHLIAEYMKDGEIKLTERASLDGLESNAIRESGACKGLDVDVKFLLREASVYDLQAITQTVEEQVPGISIKVAPKQGGGIKL